MQADGSRRQHAERSGNHRSFVGQNVAEKIFRDQYIETARPLNKTHRGIIDEQIVGLHVGVLRGDFLRNLPPQTRGGNHIRLVDDRDFLAPLPGEFIGQVQDTFYLLAGIDARVVGRITVLATALRAAEIHPAGQFADAHQIDSFHQFGTKRRLVYQRRKRIHGADIGKQPETLAHLQQSLFGTYFRVRIVIVFRRADGAEKHGVRFQAKRMRSRRIRVARLINSDSSYNRFLIR